MSNNVYRLILKLGNLYSLTKRDTRVYEKIKKVEKELDNLK